MSWFGKFKFVARLMADPEIDRIYRELKEGRLWLAGDETMAWWRREAAFLHAHSLEAAIKKGMKVGRSPQVEAGVIFMGHDQIEIGDDFVCSFGATFRAVDAAMRIGSQVNVGPLACVIGANHGTASDRPIQAQAHESLEVVIEDDVWIGAGAIVLPGSRIGRGAVIGAGSVVSGEVEPMTVAAGSPARKLRER